MTARLFDRIPWPRRVRAIHALWRECRRLGMMHDGIEPVATRLVARLYTTQEIEAVVGRLSQIATHTLTPLPSEHKEKP